MLRVGMVRVCSSHRQEIVIIEHDAPLLHDAVRTLGARLLHVPHHLLVNAIADGLISGGPLSLVKFTITVLIEQLCDNKVAVPNDTITIEVKAHVWVQAATTVLL